MTKTKGSEKIIADYPNYSISEDGVVRRIKTGSVIKSLDRNKSGYKYVDLYNLDGCKKMSIHRLVAQAFIPNPDNKPQVNHIDSNPANNHISNLEWATPRENNLHANRFGNKEIVKSNEGRFGGDSFNSKSIVAVLSTGQTITFDCAKTASEYLGISYRNLTEAARNGTYMKRKKLTAKYI